MFSPEILSHRSALRLAIAVSLLGAPTISSAQSSQQIQDITKPQIKAIQDDKANRTDAEKKMSSHLLDALNQKQTGYAAASAPNLKAQPLTATPEGVLVDIKATVSEELVRKIQELGGEVINKFPESNAIRASIPLENIRPLAERPDVKHVSPAVKARTNGGVATEGDIAHMANLARAKFGVRGAGVVIGVISDSIDDGFDALNHAYASGAMDPKKLKVLPGQEGDGEGEGLAMAEIISAIAPDAQIIFATGFGGTAAMAANIRELAKQGCQIIVDDVTYFNESPFQDGDISKAVNDVSSLGVLFFSSARNSGNKKQGTSGTWEGDFRDGGPAGPQFGVAANGRIHVFEASKGITLNTVQKASRQDRVDLFWADPLGGSKNDYDLFVVNAQGQVVGKGDSSHDGTQDPYEYVEQIRQGQSIVIVKAIGAEARFLHLDSGRAILRYGTDGSVRGHNASGAMHAFSVAAKRAPVPPTIFRSNPDESVESFSSDGPRRIFFGPDGTPLTPGNFSSVGGVVLNKPDITAANGVSTSFPKDSGFNPFLGTSAAAPHAAAIAAILLSCVPRPTPSQVRNALESSALALDGAVPNPNAGKGVVIATAAAQSVCKALQTPLAAKAGR